MQRLRMRDLAPKTPDFDKIQHIPDAVPNGERYKSFSKLYGTETTERYRPSLTTRAKLSKGMPFDRTKQTALNVGQVIQCDDCGKWCLLRAKRKLHRNEIDMLCQNLGQISYSCGSSFQDIDDDEVDVFRRQNRPELPIYN